jgi:hypothetical protein
MPGSGTQGRSTRPCPARQAALSSATARRVVPSEPANPIATRRSWATSARIFPASVRQLLELGRNGSTPRDGGADKRVGADVAHRDVGGDGLGVAADQLRRGPGAAGQVEGFQDLHDLPARPGQRSLRVGGFSGGTRSQPHRRAACTGRQTHKLDHPWPPTWISHGHQPGPSWPPTGSLSWPLSPLPAPQRRAVREGRPELESRTGISDCPICELPGQLMTCGYSICSNGAINPSRIPVRLSRERTQFLRSTAPAYGVRVRVVSQGQYRHWLATCGPDGRPRVAL